MESSEGARNSLSAEDPHKAGDPHRDDEEKEQEQGQEGRQVVAIIGGGIVGISTAYFLSLEKNPRYKIVLIEKYRLAAAASGKAGGLLGGESWSSSETRDLHAKGIRLHEELAATLDVKSFRKLPTLNVNTRKRPARQRAKDKENEETKPVLLKSGISHSLMDPDTAQVTPLELCTKMAEVAKQNGVEILIDGVESLPTEGESRKCSVKLSSGKILEADHVVVATGPWALQLMDWLPWSPNILMEGIASSSALVTPVEGTKVAATACFCSEDPDTNTHLELYPRPDDTVYICGFGGSPTFGKDKILDMSPDEVPVNESRKEDVKRAFASITSVPVDGDNSFSFNACLRPCTADGLPMIGGINDSNIILATGHNCWGITWGPITGKAVSELILKGGTSIDISACDPHRF